VPAGRRIALALCCVIATVALSASPAWSADSQAVAPSTGDATQPSGRSADHQLSRAEATRVARRDPEVAAALADHPDATTSVKATGPNQWEASFYDDGREVVRAEVDDKAAKVTSVFTGHQIAWQMARGVPGAFGRKINAVYVWVPLMALFFLGLFDWRRPKRLVNLDLLVLLSFSISQYFFNRGEIDISVPLVYPVLFYLLARMLAVAFVPRLRRPAQPWRPSLPIPWMVLLLVFLCTFRIAMNVTDSNVIDVGYSGVIGGDLVSHGAPLYGHFPLDNASGDTYGPVTYYAYVPAELVYPWHGKWDDLPAAHLASVLFDLLTIGGLLLLGRRLRSGRSGTELGIVFAFAWAAFPYSLYVMNSNANDSLVAALLVFTMVAAARPAARGMLLALASAAKFAPIALAPLFASYRSNEEESHRRQVLVFSLALVTTLVIVSLPVIASSGFGKFWDRTVGFQLGRGSPFSLWGQYGDLGWLQTVLKVAAGGLAIAVAFVPRRKDPVVLAALAAAVLIALQITLTHWFYLYIVWWFPLVLVALFAPGAVTDRTEPEPARSTPQDRLPEPSPSSP
jgi:hypothetical protein